MVLKKNNLKSLALFVLPAFFIYTFLFVYPIVCGFFYGFMDWSLTRNILEFNGINNFIQTLTDKVFLHSIMVSFLYTILVVAVSNVLGLLLAVAIESKIYLRGVVRSLFFIPNLLSAMLVAFIWKFIYTGFFPELFIKLGFNQLADISWFGTPQMALISMVIVGIWQNTGFMVLIYIAGLQSVPEELYESASIDGATGKVRFFRITIPMILPTITINLFISIANALKFYDLPLALTKGGPAHSTETVALNIFYEAFTKNNLGLACAKGFILIVFIGVLSIAQLKATSRKEELI